MNRETEYIRNNVDIVETRSRLLKMVGKTGKYHTHFSSSEEVEDQISLPIMATPLETNRYY